MPFSSISYNTESFLKSVLDELVDSKILEFYFYAFHYGEDDEAGKKDHFHVHMRPTETVRTQNLIEKFYEYDLSDLSSPPLKSLPFKSSKLDDALLYFIHDPAYLALKGQSRKYHYSWDILKTNDIDELNYCIRSIDMSALTPYKKMVDAQEVGMTFQQYFKSTYIPIQQLSHYQNAWNLLCYGNVFRNGRKGHDIGDNVYVKGVTKEGEVLLYEKDR